MHSDKLVVTVAPCITPQAAAGIPDLDLSPEGIAREVVRASQAGANVVHLHVLDETGRPTMDPSAFERTVRLIRDGCDIVIEGSTGGVNELSPAERSVSLQADIEMASLNPGSVNYDQGVYVNSPADIEYWVKEMQRRQIKPDIAVFEAGMIANAVAYVERGMIRLPCLFSFVLGQRGALPATAKNLLFLSETVPDGSVWGVAGHGEGGLWLSTLALCLGGHVRAGYEDSPYYGPGELAQSNAQLVSRLVRVARELGREPYTPDEVRSLLELPGQRSGVPCHSGGQEG